MKTIKKFVYNQKVAPYVFILPFVLSVLLFWVVPIAQGIRLSFFNTLQEEFVGLKNYTKIFSDKIFLKALYHSVRYTIGTLILLLPLPLLFATMLNSKLTSKTAGFFKSIYFIPALTSVVVAGTIFRLMFGELDTSLANQVLNALGGSSIKWLKMDWPSYFILLLLACWRWMGVNILYYLAGLQSIPADLYEAASIDGATKLQQFTHISIPLVQPTTVYVMTISIYAGLSMYVESSMLWTGNNSPMNIGLTIVGYLYRQGIEKRNMGYACAVGMILLIIVMVINILQLIANGTIKVGKKEG
ncbi:MAG: sugar ABC transporter permease [Clostridiales bacterium]|nr:sugar ABC transporter permease [Clostridiales bacterium]